MLKDILDSLGINPNAVLIQAISLILLVVLLKKFFFQKVLAFLDERQKNVEDTIEQMAADRRSMEAARSDYERRLADIEAEARERIQGAVKEAQHLREQIITDSRAQGETLIQRAQEEINLEKQKALVELRNEVADLAVGAAGKILGRNLDNQAQRDLIHGFIDDVGRA